ncbi:hypothetical protein HUJ04_003140 [Dendroctonus ponderosae]|nr:hypothetical protein HUJ04_003140 [Dendroctonus ponderosae]
MFNFISLSSRMAKDTKAADAPTEYIKLLMNVFMYFFSYLLPLLDNHYSFSQHAPDKHFFKLLNSNVGRMDFMFAVLEITDNELLNQTL